MAGTHRQYWNAVNRIAHFAKIEAEEFGDDVYDNVNESVDKSYWIKNMHAQIKVLQYTDNLGYSPFRTLEGSPESLIMQIAYYAMVQDVMDRL